MSPSGALRQETGKDRRAFVTLAFVATVVFALWKGGSQNWLQAKLKYLSEFPVPQVMSSSLQVAAPVHRQSSSVATPSVVPSSDGGVATPTFAPLQQVSLPQLDGPNKVQTPALPPVMPPAREVLGDTKSSEVRTAVVGEKESNKPHVASPSPSSDKTKRGKGSKNANVEMLPLAPATAFFPQIRPPAETTASREAARNTWEELWKKHLENDLPSEAVHLKDMLPRLIKCSEEYRIANGSNGAATVCDLQSISSKGSSCKILSISDSFDHAFELELSRFTACDISSYGSSAPPPWHDCGAINSKKGRLQDLSSLLQKGEWELVKIHCKSCTWSELGKYLRGYTSKGRVHQLILKLHPSEDQVTFRQDGEAQLGHLFDVFEALHQIGLQPYLWEFDHSSDGSLVLELGFKSEVFESSNRDQVGSTNCPASRAWVWAADSVEARSQISICRKKSKSSGKFRYHTGTHAGHDSAVVMLLPPYRPQNKSYPWDGNDIQTDHSDFERAVKSLAFLEDDNRAELRMFFDEKDNWPKEGLQKMLKAAGERDACAVAIQLTRFPPGFSEASRSPFSRRSKWGYIHMCRFFFIDLFESNALEGFKYWMRMDSDARLVGPAKFNPFAWMDQHTELGYMHYVENEDCGEFVAELKPFSTLYAQWHNLPVPFAAKDTNANCVKGFYNNLEVGRLKAFKTVAAREWRWAVEASKGIYKYRWGDAILRRLSTDLTNISVIKIPQPLWEPYHHKW